MWCDVCRARHDFSRCLYNPEFVGPRPPRTKNPWWELPLGIAVTWGLPFVVLACMSILFHLGVMKP